MMFLVKTFDIIVVKW